MGFITATMFLNYAGLTIIIPVIPYIVVRYTSDVAIFVGVITSVASLCSFFSAPVLGFVSDYVGRRPVILFSLLGGVVGYVVFGIGGALWVLFAGRIIDGLTSGDTTAMYAYIADIHEGHERTKFYGIVGAAAGLGFMVGPAIGGFAAQISLTAPLFVAAGISLLNVCWGYFVLPESLKPEHRVKRFFWKELNPFSQFDILRKSLTLRLLFIASFVFFTGLIMQQSNFSVFLTEVMGWGPTQIGIILTLVGLVDFAAEGYLTGAFTPIFGEMKIMRVGIGLTMLGMVCVGIVALTHSIVLLYIAVVIFTLGDGLFEPAMTGLTADATEPHMQGRVQGASQATQSIARVIAPLMAGVLFEWGAELPYFFAAALMIATLALVIAYRSSLTFVQA